MRTNYNYLKTLGPLAAHLVATLYTLNRPIFHMQEAIEILHNRASASKVLSQLLKHSVVMRLKPGCFRLIPFELGFEQAYLGNPYIVARELVIQTPDPKQNTYYLSHGSAFDLHQMITQPQLSVYVSAPKMMRSRTIQGTEFQFVRCKATHVFGLISVWVDKNEQVCTSDLERTLLDGLKLPKYCGGFSEVAKGFSIKRQEIDSAKLLDYALRLDVGVVIRRLGYLMELYEIGNSTQWEFLQSQLSNTYHLLDPDLPSTGHHIARWRLKLNVPQDELLALRGT